MKPYSVTPDLPVMTPTLNEYTRPVYLKQLKEISAHRIWVAPERKLFLTCGLNDIDTQERSCKLQELKQNVDYFKQNGIETGIWVQAFGFGDPLTLKHPGWTQLKSVTGHTMPKNDAFCPEDPGFMDSYLTYMKEMAAIKPDLLMLDDDLCMSVRPGIGCFCDRHMKLLEETLGERLRLEELPELIFAGGPNRYRDAWYQVMGDTLRRFCQKVRQVVDEVDPNLRVGFCSGYTSWDFEGADAIELAKLLAGKNEPFLRFTGAPYWCEPMMDRFHGQRLNAVIECARQQKVWCADSGVEVFAEADSYPRPCYTVNASYIENFDIAMRAEKIRSLKYMFDYFSTPQYELQYLKLHKRNIPLYHKIGEAFEGKQAVGVRLYAPMHRIKNAHLPEKFVGESEIMRLFFSMSAAMLTGVGVPVCYEGEAECVALFGEDVLAVDDITKYKKVILDLPAARLLQERGVDVGLAEVKKAPVPATESFLGRCDERLLLSFVGQGAPYAKIGGFYDVTVKGAARAESYLEVPGRKWISSYRYDSPSTQFLIFTFDALAAGERSTLFTSYCRQKQIMEFVGGAYPYIRGYSEVYTLCAQSEDGQKQAVLFENLSRDPVFDFEIELGRACSGFVLTGAAGELAEDKKHIRITSDFTPSSAIVLEVTYEG